MTCGGSDATLSSHPQCYFTVAITASPFHHTALSRLGDFGSDLQTGARLPPDQRAFHGQR